jgi:hypothetical protein
MVYYKTACLKEDATSARLKKQNWFSVRHQECRKEDAYYFHSYPEVWMIKIMLVVVSLLLAAGCSAPSFVMIKPYIDVDETLVLAPKMTKNSVLQYIGTPVEVRAGILLRDSSVIEIWLYNVKEKLVKIPIEDINTKPPKNSKASKWDAEKEYALFFLNDGLVKWGYLDDKWPQFEKFGDIYAPIPFSKSDTAQGQTSMKGGLFGILKGK